MSNNFDDLPTLSLPPGWELVAKNLEKLKLYEVSIPFTDEQMEYFNKVAKQMAASVASVPPEVIESFQTQRSLFQKLYKNLSIGQNLGEQKVKKTEEVAQEIVDEYSEDLNPVVQMAQEGIDTASEVNWNEIKALELNEEIPEAEAKKLRNNSLFSLMLQKLHKFDPRKITKSDAYEWFKLLQTLLSFINICWSLIEKASK